MPQQDSHQSASPSATTGSQPDDPLFFQRLVESVSDYAIYMLSLDGHISSWNLGAERFKGYRAAEIIGQHFSVFYTEEDRARGRPQRALHIARTEGRFEDRAWRVRKNGERFRAHVIIDPVRDEQGNMIGFAKITRDISETWAKEQALIESERRFRILVSSVTDYAIYLLDLDGHINSWNAGAQRFKNYREEEVLGRHFSMFYTPEDQRNDKPARALKTALEHGRFEDTGWRVRKDGSAFWAHVVLDLIRDESGAPAGFAKITRDITERRDAEIRLKNLARNNQELEQFVHIASHDLREPLRKVLAFCDLWEYEEGEQLSDNAKTYLANITAATRRMRGLLDSLLSLSRVTTHGASFEACDLNRILDEVCTDMALTIEESNARIHSQALPDLEADPHQMRQLFQNLIGNSIKYARENLAPEIHIRCLPVDAENLVAISVSDNGIGFDPAYSERIFDVFERLHTRDAYEGAGIGLSVCQRICRRHHGDISCNAKPDSGATFTITLPQSQQQAET